jgi:HPt (histidine-containing phosphotransfer) domain-containing protein
MERDLWLKFRERFFQSSETRLGRARAIIASGDPANDALASELHALAGEASVLGVETMARIAREAERTAKSWGAAATDSERARACQLALDDLDEALRQLGATVTQAPPRPL